jgi:hypothetical protein
MDAYGHAQSVTLNSLIPAKNFQLLEILSLLICVGNCAKSDCGAAVSCYEIGLARCHLITVSGFTIAKAPSTFGAKRYKPANIRRSSIPNVGRFGDCRRNALS